MGVKWFLRWEPNEGSSISSQMIIDEAKKYIEKSLEGVKNGRWETTLSYYKPILQNQSTQAEFPNEFLGISLGDVPSKYYYVVRRKKLVVEADSSIQTIMHMLNSYQCVLSFHFEGFQYKIGQFILRIGKVVPNNFQTVISTSIIMEVEYILMSSIETAKGTMKEFVEKWQEEMSKRSLGNFVNQTVKFEEFGLADEYTLRHTAVQYAYFTTRLLKKLGDELLA